MEAETIDLTDPLEDLLRQTGLSPEHLQERILRVSEENARNANINQKSRKEMTLSDLLEGYKCGSSTNNKVVEVTEIIELSDDEVEVIDHVTNKSESELQQVNEVRVIEIDDDDIEYNDDDDDEFLEESTTDILHSNSKAIYESSSVLDDEDVDSNLTLNENTSNSLRSVDTTESKESVTCLSENKASEDCDKTYDLVGKESNILLQENGRDKCHDNIAAVAERSSEIIKENDILSEYEQKQDDASNFIRNVNLDDQDGTDRNKQRSKNTLNLNLVDNVEMFLSFKSVSTSGSSYKSALSELDESVCLDSGEHVENTKSNSKDAISKFDESIRIKRHGSNDNTINNKSDPNELDESISNNGKISNDLGLIVSKVQGKVNMIDSAIKAIKIATKEANANDGETVESPDNLILNQDLTFNKCLVSNTVKENINDNKGLNFNQDSNNTTNSPLENLSDQKSLLEVNSDKLCNNISFDIQGIKPIDKKSVRTSIDKIIEQLDLACQGGSIENNLKEAEGNNIIDATTLVTDSKVSQAFSNSLEIDSSTRCLLKSLDEAIETCDKNNKECKHFVQENVECSEILSQTSVISPVIKNTPCKPYTIINKIKDNDALLINSVAEASKNNIPIAGTYNECRGVNDEFSRQSVNYINSDNITDDLLKISTAELNKNIKNITVEAKSTTDKEKDPTDTLPSVNNGRDQNYKYMSEFAKLGSSCRNTSMTNNILDSKIQFTEQSDVQRISDQSMELIGSQVKEGFMGETKLTSMNFESKRIVSSQPLIHQTNVKEDVVDKKLPMHTSAQEILGDCVSLKSEVIFNQLFQEQIDVKEKLDQRMELNGGQARKKSINSIGKEQTATGRQTVDKNIEPCCLAEEDPADPVSVETDRLLPLQNNMESVATHKGLPSNSLFQQESLMDDMNLTSEKVIPTQPDNELESSASHIKHCCPTEKPLDSISINIDSEKVVVDKLLIDKTNVEGHSNVLDRKSLLINRPAHESEKIISSQHFKEQIYVKETLSERTIDSIFNQTKEKLGNPNQSITIQRNEKEDLTDNSVQPGNSYVAETCMNSISIESEKIISNQLQLTDVELNKSTKPISSQVRKNLIDSSKPFSSKTVDKSSAEKDAFTVNKNLIKTRMSQEKSQYHYESDEDNSVEENSSENFEEIRKNLKLQLTSLRNRKRMDILHDVKTKVINTKFSSSRELNLKQQPEDLLKLVSNEANQKSNENLRPINQDINVSPGLTNQSNSAIDLRENKDIHTALVEPDYLAETVQLESIKENTEVDVSHISLKHDLVPLITNPLEKVHSGPINEQHEDEDVTNALNEIRKIIRKQKTGPKTPLFKSIHNLKDSEEKNEDNYKTESKTRDNITTELSDSTTAQDCETPIFPNLEHKNTLSSSVVISPFISNTLDEFLTDAKLNVSYTIPKSGAEEGLRQNYSDEPIMPQVIPEIKEEDTEKTIQETKYKPKTLAEKRRLLERNKIKEKKKLDKLKKLEEAQKRSYILFKDKIIFLKAKSMGKCIASIESSIPLQTNTNQSTTPRKPSLLTELYKKATTPVKYRPGPLCKKYLLQTDYSNWTTELQALPKVILKLMPQLGKPIHRNLLHILPQWDGEVTDDQIGFALSALVTKDNQKQNKIFEFDVPYEKRQTQILTRKRTLDKPPVKLSHFATTREHSSTSEQDVAEVIEKLLNYVEIKEIAPTLVKYDEESAISDGGSAETHVQPVGNQFLVKRKSRFSKTDRELLRLNCKVVSVEVEETEPNQQCSKPYCRLGCICKSLQCERIIGLHCQKVKCIFGCSCPKENDKVISIAEPTIKLPAGTDLLSMDTVTRIEGEAKRNLAKLEKEFTQTVIHTNDKTIVVGFGNKPRRATKTPKKYTFDDDISKEEIKEPKKEKIIPIQQCSVVLENWDFSDILPYCLVHHLYKCHCRGLSVFRPNSFFENFKKEELLILKKEEILSSSENNGSTLVNKNNDKQLFPKQTVEESFKAIIRKSAGVNKNIDSESDFEETLYSVTGRPLRKKKKLYEAEFVFNANAPSSSRKSSDTDRVSHREPHSKSQAPFVYFEPSHCSRTRAISKKYYRKVTSFTNAALYFDFANNLTQADLLKSLQQDSEKDVSDSDILKRTIIEERKKLLEDTENEIHKKKRKQKLQVREDENLTIRTTEKTVSVPKPDHKVGVVKSVFKGEIIVNDSEWLKKLGQNSKQPLEGYARILPWSALLNGFLSKSLNIYCITDMPLRLLLNVGLKLSGEKILDVETFGHEILGIPLKPNAAWLLSQSENVREIIKWLLSGTLPLRYKTTGLSFLLVETFPGQFEVRGLCTQGDNKQCIQENQTDLPEEGEIPDQLTEVKHKNMDGHIESLFITKGKFRLRELVEDGCDDDHTDNLYMWVGLPEVYKVAKWRVVFLNNDFAYLYFKNIQYSIKYTDLVKLTQMAKEEAVTLVLRNVEIRKSYEHNVFGIYISHHYIDRLFIGPYFINYDEDEVETLRYINQQLVSSECFNKMTGNQNYRCGHWMYERTYSHTPKVYMKDTIDLTKDDTPPRPSKKDRQQKLKTSLSSVPSTTNSTPIVSTVQPLGGQSTKEDHIIYHNGMPIHIKNSKPRSPTEFNRFIITNIPHFGYLGAYQPDNSPTLEVSWPFEKKVLQFENADNARDFLQERFNQLLQPVPETFKIQVIVLLQLDLHEHQPINSDFLSGHCICGYFGTYNFREISNEFCKQKLNISKEEITKLFAKRAHAYIRRKIEDLAEIVGINQNDCVNFNVPTILDKARTDIKSQESIRRQHVSKIQAHELEVVDKMKKLYKLVNILPIKQRNIESKIINEILQIRPKRLGANEVVEIKDDDDDNERPTTNIQSDAVVFNIESDDTIVPEQPKKKSLKRKRTNGKKTSSKMAKVSSFSSTPGPSTSVLKPFKAVKVADLSKKTNESKQSVLLVKPSQTVAQPLTEIKGRNIITIKEDGETIVINEDIETDTINEEVETLGFNDDFDRVTFNDNIETLTIHGDMNPILVNTNVEPLEDNKDIETLTIINEDMETENLIDEDDNNHYIIEFDGDDYDPNITEILVSHPDRAENIDLSKATIIASVPPTNIKNDSNSVTVSVLTPEIQTPLIKTYSKNKTAFVHSTVSDTEPKAENSANVSSSKELKGKIKLGLQKIMEKSEGNLLLLNDRENISE